VRQTSSAAPLAWLYASLIGYASLYPFSPWRPVAGPLFEFLLEPSAQGVTRFDLWSNILGYLPLGTLVVTAWVRAGGRSTGAAIALTTLAGAALSLAMETVQNFLPSRVPSAVDFATNTLGALAGALVGAALQKSGSLGQWRSFRERWFIDRSGGALVLLLLWPVALLMPAPLPFGLGQVLGELLTALAAALEGSPAQDWAIEWLEQTTAFAPLARASELGAVACGLLAPCAVGFSIATSPWRRVVLLLGAALIGFFATTLATALSFGPQHALAWLTPTASGGLLAGLCLGLPTAWLPRRICAGIGLIALCTLIAIVSQAPTDPYYAQSLQAWEQGRFIHFHGSVRWVGWLWPYAALVFLLLRLGAREERT
jgi:VanZ family protein